MMLKKTYPGLSWAENLLGGHLSIGSVTIYGENAMHWAVNIRTMRWGYVCFRLPLRCFGRWWPLYFYVSPNGTPWASTFYRGQEKTEVAQADCRRERFGHNFDTEICDLSKCDIGAMREGES